MAIRRLTERHRSRRIHHHCGQISATLRIKHDLSTYHGLASSIHGHTARHTSNLEGSSWASSTNSSGRWHRCHAHCLHHLYFCFIIGVVSKKKECCFWMSPECSSILSHLIVWPKKAPPKEGALFPLHRKKKGRKTRGFGIPSDIMVSVNDQSKIQESKI